jgi:hypothetical protein
MGISIPINLQLTPTNRVNKDKSKDEDHYDFEVGEVIQDRYKVILLVIINRSLNIWVTVHLDAFTK